MKIYGVVKVYFHAFLTSALDVTTFVSPLPSPFYVRETGSGAQTDLRDIWMLWRADGTVV
jgi:hypothetical protein